MYPSVCLNTQELTSPSQRETLILWHTPLFRCKVIGSGLQSTPRQKGMQLYFWTVKDCHTNFYDKTEPLQEEMCACRGGSHATRLKEEPTPPPRGACTGSACWPPGCYLWTPTCLEKSGYIAHTSVSTCLSYWQGLILAQRWQSSSNFSSAGIDSWT
jgi:hypothetical protein